MKKTFLLCTFLVGSLLFYNSANAQLRVHVNINARPAWGHPPSWHRGPDIVLINDRGRRNHGHRRDWDNRGWERNNGWHNDRYGRDDRGRSRNYGDRYNGKYEKRGRGKW